MKILTQVEKDALAGVEMDVSITIDNTFLDFPKDFSKNLKSLIPIFVGLYFRSANHDPENPKWKNRDYVFPINNYASIMKSLVKVHAGYDEFSNLENYLKKYPFSQIENTFGEAIGYYISAHNIGDKHERFYYIVVSELDLLNNFSALEFILKNNMRRVIVIAYTKTGHEEINKENKLNGKLINLGFDTLVVDGSSSANICEAISYAKNLTKPSIILANIN